MSIKTVIAAIALGAALLAVPAAANAKVVHKATKLHASKVHPKKLHTRHVKHTALHAKRSKAHTLSHSKTAHTAVSSGAGWKHHRAI